MTHRLSAIVVASAFGAVVCAVALAPQLALAHARWKSSTPGKGEVLATSPPAVEIVFTQNVQKVAGTYGITVNRDRGGDVASGPPALDDTDRSKLSVPLQPNLPAGRYVVNWHNVSDDDGDPAEGAFAFYVGVQPTAVDLANDQQLEQIGAEETTGAGSPTAGASPPATARPGATSTAPSALASPTPASPSSGGGGSNAGLIIGIGVAVAVVLIAGGGWFTFVRNRP